MCPIVALRTKRSSFSRVIFSLDVFQKSLISTMENLLILRHFMIFLETGVTEAMFRGREGIKYDFDQLRDRGVDGGAPILASNDKISFYFKTGRSSGLLYYNGRF